MPFETALCFALLIAGIGFLAYLSFRRTIWHLGQGRRAGTRATAKISYTYSGFFAFLGMMLVFLLLLVFITAIGILAVGGRAAVDIQ